MNAKSRSLALGEN